MPIPSSSSSNSTSCKAQSTSSSNHHSTFHHQQQQHHSAKRRQATTWWIKGFTPQRISYAIVILLFGLFTNHSYKLYMKMTTITIDTRDGSYGAAPHFAALKDPQSSKETTITTTTTTTQFSWKEQALLNSRESRRQQQQTVLSPQVIQASPLPTQAPTIIKEETTTQTLSPTKLTLEPTLSLETKVTTEIIDKHDDASEKNEQNDSSLRKDEEPDVEPINAEANVEKNDKQDKNETQQEDDENKNGTQQNSNETEKNETVEVHGEEDTGDDSKNDKNNTIDLATTTNKKTKTTVAYAISITSCPFNSTSIKDGPAILQYSIHQAHANSTQYDYKLIAFVHPNATTGSESNHDNDTTTTSAFDDCHHVLTTLGFQVLVRDTPIDTSQIDNSHGYQKSVEDFGCCGSREFLKLWSWTLVEYDVVVHMDTDTFLLKPLDPIFNVLLERSTIESSQLDTLHHDFKTANATPIEFFFTRDYAQSSSLSFQVSKYGVQGGFFVLKPSMTIFDDMKHYILQGFYTRSGGWHDKGYGGYWGAPQIQGFLSFYYGSVRPRGAAVELNRCIYNAMVDDVPRHDKNPKHHRKRLSGKCKTGGEQDSCQDCRITPLEDIVSVHLTTCWKPWHCPTLKKPHPERCKDVHRAWFMLRQALELSWNYTVPTQGWWFQRTLGYCTKAGGAKKRYYLPLKLPDNPQ